MTEDNARTVANAILVSAGLAGGDLVITTPPPPRLALRGPPGWLRGRVPLYFPTQFEFITTQLVALRGVTASMGVAGTLALVWGAVGFFGAISTAVNYAWGVEKQRSFWKHKLFSFVMLLVAGLILLIALLLISASQVVGASWFAGVLARFPGLGILRGFTVRHATTLLFILVVALIYY